MRRMLLAVLALLLSTTTIASADDFIALGSAAGPLAPREQVEVVASDLGNGAVRLEYVLHGFEMTPVMIDGRVHQLLRLGREGRFLDAGAPDLPKIARSVIIPDDAEMEARLVSAEWREFSGVDIAPSKGNLTRNVNPATVAFEFGSTYRSGGWFPEESLTLGDPYIMRDFRGLVVDFRPFRYDAVTHTLQVCERAVIEVVPAGPGRINVLADSRRAGGINREFRQLYADHFVNFLGDETRYPDPGEIGEMLVIAYDSFVPNMQPLVDWKNQMGIPTTLLSKSEVGSTSAEIASFISGYYAGHDLAFVLLVGDYPQMPSPVTGGAASDPVYALVAGSDSYPDLFVGRLSAENSGQVDLQVQKFVEYEQLPQAGNNWYHMGVGIGSAEGAGIGDDGEADYVHIGNIRNDLLHFTYTYVDEIYDPGATASQVGVAVNQGRSIINYCGHGSTTSWSTTGFSVSHVNALTNYNELPFIFSVACVNGNFQSTTCFAEAWLRANQGGVPTGAVGMYASTINMSWAPPMAGQDESVDLLVQDRKRTFGALCFCGSGKMMDEYGSSGINEFKHWHVFGDPSLRVRTDAPAELTVEHDATIDGSATSFTVTVPGAMGALCGLSADGEYLGSAFTDATGEALIELAAPLAAAELTLTVTDFNMMPYVAAIPVFYGPQPALAVSPEFFHVEMGIDEIHQETLFVTNSGAEGSLLGYTIAVNGIVGQPWLSVTPNRGSLPAGQTAETQVTFDARVIGIGTYTAEIQVSAPNLDPVTVAVELVVGDPSAVGDRGHSEILALLPAQPNPFAGATTLAFQLPQAGEARLAVYDMNGRLVRGLFDGPLGAGLHLQAWDGRDDQGRALPDGVYFYRLDADGERISEKVMRVR